jgi:hypothetical protein
MPPVPRAKTVGLAVAALVFFLAFHAWLAFSYRPATSDTPLYAEYAFLTSDPGSGKESPYDRFERRRREHAALYGRLPPRPDQVTVEYPPLALELLRAPLPLVPKVAASTPRLGKRATEDWIRGFRLLYFLGHALVMVSAIWWLGRRGFGWVWGLVLGTVGGIMLSYVLYDRLDLWLGLVLLGALSALVTGHRNVALALLAVAVNLKLVPVLLVPLFMLGALPASVAAADLAGRRTLRVLALPCAVFVTCCVALFLPFRLLWGPRVWDFLAFHGQRGFQVESTWSSLLFVAARLGYPAEVTYKFGADCVVGPGTTVLAKASAFVTLAVVVLTYWFAWRSLRRWQTEREVASPPAGTLAEWSPQFFVWGSFAVLAAAMASSKVFSPQYLCWFLPGFLLAKRPKDAPAATPFLVFLLACGLTTLVFPHLWPEVIRPAVVKGRLVGLLPTARATLVMLTRNLAWIGFCALAIAQLRSAWPQAEAVPISRQSRARKRRRRR